MDNVARVWEPTSIGRWFVGLAVMNMKLIFPTMISITRGYGAPIVAFITLALGIGSVSAVRTVVALFSPSQPEATPSELHDFSGTESAPVSLSTEPIQHARTVDPLAMTCRDAALRPIWKRLVKDFLSDGVPDHLRKADCNDFFETKRIDLNNDGRRDLLIRGKESPVCLWNGNCVFIVVRNTRVGYQPILGVIDYWEATGHLGKQIRRRRTNGFHDLTVAEHLNSSDTMYTRYSFHKRGYKEASCKVNAYVRGTAPKERWKLISCREYKRLGY